MRNFVERRKGERGVKKVGKEGFGPSKGMEVTKQTKAAEKGGMPGSSTQKSRLSGQRAERGEKGKARSRSQENNKRAERAPMSQKGKYKGGSSQGGGGGTAQKRGTGGQRGMRLFCRPMSNLLAKRPRILSKGEREKQSSKRKPRVAEQSEEKKPREKWTLGDVASFTPGRNGKGMKPLLWGRRRSQRPTQLNF